MENYTALLPFGKKWLLFRRPTKVLRAETLSEIDFVMNEVHFAAERGLYAVGWLTYEAAPFFDSALSVKCTSLGKDRPLAWFGIYDPPLRLAALPKPTASFELGRWRPTMSKSRYVAAIKRIKKYLAAGHTYQVNYTMTFESSFKGDPYALFFSLVMAQSSEFCAFVLADSCAICSASPELFIQLSGRRLISRPMKGTAPRGLTVRQDEQRKESLRLSEKNRAENVMIVDMIRNDMGRIARPGTVRVASLFDIEKYRTVFQMTSTVECLTDANLKDVLKAMFPCASITGAPKVRTMEIIRELERGPRGVYTGIIGMVAPRRQVRFNVAIRTVEIDLEHKRARYGVGGGIVWDSATEDEYRECLVKSAVLMAGWPEFELLESILWRPRFGYFLIQGHLKRMFDSASYFERPFRKEAALAILRNVARNWRRRERKVRLLVDAEGHFRVQTEELKETREPFRIALAKSSVNSKNVFLYHKTTNRTVYEKARRDRPDADDVLLFNENGEITESTIGNVVIDLDGCLVTPPIECGLLGGVYREHLLRKRILQERKIDFSDLRKASGVWIINSVRRWIKAVVIS